MKSGKLFRSLITDYWSVLAHFISLDTSWILIWVFWSQTGQYCRLGESFLLLFPRLFQRDAMKFCFP